MKRFLLVWVLLCAFCSLSVLPASAGLLWDEKGYNCQTWIASNYGRCAWPLGVSLPEDAKAALQAEQDKCLAERMTTKPSDCTDVSTEAILKAEVQLDGSDDPAKGFLRFVTDFLVQVGIAAGILLIVYGGFKYISSSITGSGDGKEYILRSLKWLSLLFLAYAFVALIIRFFADL